MTDAQLAKLDRLIVATRDRVESDAEDVQRAMDALRYEMEHLSWTLDLGELATRVDRARAAHRAAYEKLRALEMVRDAT